METGYFGVRQESKNSRRILLASLGVLALVGVVAVVAVYSNDATSATFEFQVDEEDFHTYMLKNNKFYTTKEEYKLRYSIFRDNVKKIRDHNAKNLSWTLGINQFADLTWEEFAELKNIRPIERKPAKNVVSLEHIIDVPTSVDWSQKGAVTDVKDQGQCGSCWSFSTTGAIEGAWAIAKGELVTLSEQQLVDCSSDYGNAGCNGGWMDSAFQYVIDNGGLVSEDDYPYTAYDGYCDVQGSVKATISSFVDVAQNNEAELLKAVAQQPVAVAVEADESAWQFYESGVVTDGCHDNLDHGVLLVGYGTENGTDFWKIKNSWGTGWGDQGYIRVLRTSSTSSSGVCGVAAAASYPVV
jgi:C1A family cysteine protease